MSRACTVCHHTDRREIEGALEAGKPYREIAAQYGTSIASLARHRRGHSQSRIPLAESPGSCSTPGTAPGDSSAAVERSGPPASALTLRGGHKVYRCDRYPELSIGGLFRFVRGEFVTEDPRQQDLIGRSASFVAGYIRIVDEPEGSPTP